MLINCCSHENTLIYQRTHICFSWKLSKHHNKTRYKWPGMTSVQKTSRFTNRYIRCTLIHGDYIWKFKVKRFWTNFLQKEIYIKYTMQNKFSNLFSMCQIHHNKLLLSDYLIKIHAPTTGEWISKNSRMINRSVCTSVTSVFKTSGRKGHFWSYAGAKTIMKRFLSHQHKETSRKCWKKWIC